MHVVLLAEAKGHLHSPCDLGMNYLVFKYDLYFPVTDAGLHDFLAHLKNRSFGQLFFIILTSA